MISLTMLLMPSHTTLKNKTPQLKHGMSFRAPPLPLRDDETTEGLQVAQGIKSKQKPKGGPRTKERRASIASKDNEEK